MKVLIVGAGVVGTVYGAHLAAAGNAVSVLRHGPRTDEVTAGGLCAREVTGGGLAEAGAAVVPDASGNYDIVLVAVRRDQLASACAGLAGLAFTDITMHRWFPEARVAGVDRNHS